MLDNFFLLKEVSKFLEKEISGYKITEIFTQEKDKLIISFLNQKSNLIKFIEFSCDDKIPYLILKNNFHKAKKNLLNLLTGLYEQSVSNVSIYNNDRIIKLDLSDGNTSAYFIFFKSKYNLFAVQGGKITDTFKNKKDYLERELSDIIEKKGTSAGNNIETVKDYYRSEYRHYGDSVFKEILFQHGLKAESKINNELIKLIDSEILYINEKFNEPEYLIYKCETGNYTSLISLKHKESCEKNEYKNINELAQDFIKLYYDKTVNRDVKKNVLKKKENDLKNSEKKYKSLLQQLEYAKDYAKLKTFGELILVNIHLINKGDEILILDKEYFPEKYEISLKKELNPSENANMYFEKYKKQKNSIDILKEKIKKQLSEIDIIRKEIEEIKENENLKSLKMIEKEFSKEDETSRFRKIKLDDKYEVWVGKDSASNDLLTMRYSSQNDLWFHVRGASGSHTVLKISDKKEPPEKRIIGKAASVAAYYSKARNASNVPVAYCERKYVKKKKGFKEGSVIMEREKVIFVKPGLPEDIG